MKITYILMLGIGLVSLKGFANPFDSDNKSSGTNHALKTEWISRLNDKTSWRKRVKVRDAVVTSFIGERG